MAILTPERTHLPTVAEIEASLDVLSIRTNAIKVVRVPGTLRSQVWLLHSTFRSREHEIRRTQQQRPGAEGS
jgi:hypothetical protein